MSAPPERNRDGSIDVLTVFSGSSPEDVSHARQLWRSLCMPTPLESRLVSADIPQRLPVSRPERSVHSGPPPPRAQPPTLNAAQQREDERQRYLSMAAQRKETLALLRRQREQRIQKELLSAAFKPKAPGDKTPRENTTDLNMEEEMVRQLD
ncbi:cilia- and flagella-associated protein HOATZ [Syngnathoides biaculeatus]|uniref:cilia- and flagella-associated protein HOATZ n=1 Tax=Syngnathoides biaculeatus TaxID=300417 RepID=UPI002ADE21F7|nr:cilia- and flagella-associated protein HOATZ [Syngnathoides biaculeatus]